MFICDIKTSRTDVINHLIHIWGLSAKANEKVFSPTIYRADEYSQLQKALDEEFNWGIFYFNLLTCIFI